MRVAIFNTKFYDRRFLAAANERLSAPHELIWLEPQLSAKTARLAEGCVAISAFVNDELDAACLEQLAAIGVKLIALRCAGFNQVDLASATQAGIKVLRVPAYSPYAVAEHVLALALTLNRKTHRAHNRVREGNFSIDGLLGFDFHGCTVGIVGTGKIGECVARIFNGMGCDILAYDLHQNPAVLDLGAHYTSLKDLFGQSDLITLHCPLLPQTYHLINDEAVASVKPGVMLINTSRGALIDTAAVTRGLKSGQIGYLGLDVYEEEEKLFFEDHSSEVIQDDQFMRLLTFPNVLITSHQAFFTRNALENIAQTTMENLTAFEDNAPLINEVR